MGWSYYPFRGFGRSVGRGYLDCYSAGGLDESFALQTERRV